MNNNLVQALSGVVAAKLTGILRLVYSSIQATLAVSAENLSIVSVSILGYL